MDFFGVYQDVAESVERSLSPVDSCEGMGDPACFYVTLVFVLNGLMMSLFLGIQGVLQWQSARAMVTVLCFFFSHGESTFGSWTPPLRELLKCPFLVLQMLLVTASASLGVCFLLHVWKFDAFGSVFLRFLSGLHLGAISHPPGKKRIASSRVKQATCCG
ncbi:hypothetical protein AAFF_G00170610 [Aldrovandia affinis]|uniref:Uncharacterized protein n=1 Tax=Aldrovandia affinis TaxID=143900 RepID=A0AAD7R0A0_9TELE|nr:hypothetical protein AAFF_G00170610 [Aldrovandia affinis]